MEKEEKEKLAKFIKSLAKYGMTYNPNIRDCSNDPNVVRKRERAKEVLEKCNMPEDWR